MIIMAASIKGLQKTSVVDFPPYVACTVFISTCNFRCGFCHNTDLVNDSGKLKQYSEEEILNFLDSKRNILDGVCISGGEPTLYPSLKAFIKKIKDKGFKVKLDTNGTNPGLLKELIDDKLLDYIAMDIKASKENYEKATDVKVNMGDLNKSIEIIKNSNVDYEFRTTIVPELIDETSIIDIAEWLRGSKKYALQQFDSSKHLLNKSFEAKQPYEKEMLDQFKDILQGNFDVVEVRA